MGVGRRTVTVMTMHSQDTGGWKAVGLLWGSIAPTVRGPRPKFDVNAVAHAGVAIADGVGLDNVTMAAVAARLGLTTTGLYRYVDSKETLVELMVDVAAGPPPDIASETDWRAALQRWAEALLHVLMKHPWMCDVRPTRPPRCPNGLAWYAGAVEALDQAGVASAADLVLEVNVLLRGYVALSAYADGGSPPDGTPTWFQQEVAARYSPVLTAPATSQSLIEQFWRAFGRLVATTTSAR